MPHAEGNVTIAKPVKDVYEFLLDGKNNTHWRPAVIDISKVAGTPNGVGAQFKQGVKGPGGRRIDGDYEVVEAQPDKLIKFNVIAGPARPTGTFKLDGDNKSTKLTFILDYTPKGLFAKLMGGMIQSTMNAEISTLSNLKAYLEK